jgi:hypothetical protein
LLRWGIHNCLDEVYVPFFGAFRSAWDDASLALGRDNRRFLRITDRGIILL